MKPSIEDHHLYVTKVSEESGSLAFPLRATDSPSLIELGVIDKIWAVGYDLTSKLDVAQGDHTSSSS
jgi:hypothetical protein